MDRFALSDSPPTDFVTFLAQRSGLSPEAAEDRLERWLGEYQATSAQRPKGGAKRDQALHTNA